MRSIQVTFDSTSRAVGPLEGASPEPWEEVCERFDNDVQRVMDVDPDPDPDKGYTALYVCHDENNQAVYFLVEEGEALARLRRKTFLSKLGRPPS